MMRRRWIAAGAGFLSPLVFYAACLPPVAHAASVSPQAPGRDPYAFVLRLTPGESARLHGPFIVRVDGTMVEEGAGKLSALRFHVSPHSGWHTVALFELSTFHAPIAVRFYVPRHSPAPAARRGQPSQHAARKPKAQKRHKTGHRSGTQRRRTTG